MHGRHLGVGQGRAGIRISFSEAFAIAASVFAGSDLVSGIGGLDCAKGYSLDQMVLDSYVWDNFRSFLRDFRIDGDSVALEVTRQVGHGNSFLSHPHTARNFRKELHFWDRSKLAMEATLSDRMLPEAREIARRLLREHDVAPLDKEVVRRGDQVLSEYLRRTR